jgi:hypothetical protein
MRVLDSPSYLGHQANDPAWFLAQGRANLLQAATRRVFHAEVGNAILAFRDLVDGKNVWMIEAGGGLGFTTKTGQGLVGIRRDNSEPA